MPASPAHLHPLPPPPRLSRVGRTLAALQVLKETLTIIFLGLPLVQAAPLVLLSAVPGLLLYFLHWYLALGRIWRRLAGLVWAATLLDELWGLLLFEQLINPTRGQVRLLYWSYFLGLGIILLALAELGWRWWQRRAKARRYLHGPAETAPQRG